MEKYFESITWAQIDPHSTQKKGRTCQSCHQNPKAVGLGYGKISFQKGKLFFEALEKSVTKNPKISLSQIVTPEGKTLVKFNRPEMRGFNEEELLRILRVGLCLNCHSEKDKLFKTWKRDTRCPKFPHL
ncbi:hypothetical protein THC_0973 [Caldimicrobium thiodismutans]|uniref:Cytochrome C n=1 Tax=Caldimicrobium thiodismutans TaxID=1653476 RepID=A0A0U4W2Q3_9BACT|nr:hypothetical protein [Caldimicrobium thiodismutans]BAU23357.1 hypothetical protein THC_0973 [Caldimicrobium thiodismutans]